MLGLSRRRLFRKVLHETKGVTMRVQPRPALAWLIGIGYALLFLGLEVVMGVGYDEIAASTGNIIRGMVVPLAVGSAVLAVLTTALGWWRPVLRELPDGPPRPPRWLLVVPILVFVATLLGIDYGNLGDMGGAMVLWLALGVAMVGFSEEITYRGLALVGFRGRYGEVRVWLFTSILFGLLHSVNVILGQGAVLTIRQVWMAFVIGSVFYAIRRISGTIIVPMVLHALWDFGTFTKIAGKATGVADKVDLTTAGMGLVQNLVLLVALILVIVGAAWILRTKNPKAGVATAN
jgi:membrane protease YdiL (CAAX protease family)